MDRLNYFAPYQSKEAHEEDSLTRAFLVLLRHVPLLEAAFLDLIRDQLQELGAEHRVPPLSQMPRAAEVRTQVSQILDTEGRIVSVLLTDSPLESPIKNIAWSDRHGSGGARYDGYISYGDWIFLIEHKPHAGSVWREQLNPARKSVTPDNQLELEEHAAVVVWSDFLSALDGLLQRQLLSGAEKKLAEDFRSYILATFQWLNPHPTLGSCHRNQYLLNRRCEDILDSVASDAGLTMSDSNWIDLPAEVARRAYLWSEVPADSAEGGDIVLGIWAADNKTQAEKFRARITTDRLQELDSRGWEISPNLIFRRIQQRICANPVEGYWEAYFEFWKSHEQRIGRYNAADASALLDRLTANGLLTADRRSEVEARIGKHVDVTPGMHLQFRWPIADAARLDENREFTGQVRDKLAEVLALFGQPHVLTSQQSQQEQETLTMPLARISATGS